MGKGTSDLVGFTEIEITKEMVGRKIAVFTAIEVKDAKGRLSAEQQSFLKLIDDWNGIAAVARSLDSAARSIFNWFPKNNAE